MKPHSLWGQCCWASGLEKCLLVPFTEAPEVGQGAFSRPPVCRLWMETHGPWKRGCDDKGVVGWSM